MAKCYLLMTFPTLTDGASCADFWGPLFVVLLYALISIYGQLGVCPSQ